MSLNIKSQRTVALVRELAARTGTNQTAAVEDAVARRLSELDREDRARAEAGAPPPNRPCATSTSCSATTTSA